MPYKALCALDGLLMFPYPYPHAPRSQLIVTLINIAYQECDNLPIQAREGMAFPRDVPRAQPEGHPKEKPYLPELGWEEWHSFSSSISSSVTT